MKISLEKCPVGLDQYTITMPSIPSRFIAGLVATAFHCCWKNPSASSPWKYSSIIYSAKAWIGLKAPVNVKAVFISLKQQTNSIVCLSITNAQTVTRISNYTTVMKPQFRSIFNMNLADADKLFFWNRTRNADFWGCWQLRYYDLNTVHATSM